MGHYKERIARVSQERFRQVMVLKQRLIELYQNSGFLEHQAHRQTHIDLVDWDSLATHLSLPENVERFLEAFHRNNPDWEDPDKNEGTGEAGTPQ